MNIENDAFDWKQYERNSGLIPNPNIKTKDPSEKCFCWEPNAQDLYDAYFGGKSVSTTMPLGGKDVENGQLLPITGIASVTDQELYFEVNNMTAVSVSVNKNKKFYEHYGLTKPEFINWIKTETGRTEFLSSNHKLSIEKQGHNVSGSLIKGLQTSIREEFMKQKETPTHAYEAKILSRNQGGFLIEVQGISAFLPGGLAAANKITDFESYIGRTVMVMVEDYLPEIQTFIMSNKKYVQHMLPIRAAELDLSMKHTGFVTGSSKHGVFIEFDELFTGLLHTSKMDPITKSNFDAGVFQPGDQYECWILEVNSKYQLVLSDYEPGTQEEPDEYADLVPGNAYMAKITGTKDFGVFVKLTETPKHEVGLIPRNSPNNYLYRVGDVIKVMFRNDKAGKLYFDFFQGEKN